METLFPRTTVVEDVREAYRLWAPLYPPTAHNALMRAEQVVVEAMLPDLTGLTVLDLGTGSGRYLPILARAGAQSAVGVDLSWDMLTAHGHDRSCICADARQLPFPGQKFDVVLCSLMVGDVADFAGWGVEVARVLRPGGRLLYSGFHPTWIDRGWQRAFRASDGRTIALPLHVHSPEHQRRTLEACGFERFSLQVVYLDPRDAGGAGLPPPRFALPAFAKASARPRQGSRMSSRANDGGWRATPKRSEGGQPRPPLPVAIVTTARRSPLPRDGGTGQGGGA